MAKKSSLSGFPEWLPQQRYVELEFLDILREIFELHGFSPLETRAVEPVEELLRKGETSKEIYLLSRLQDQDGGPTSRALGLHFDLTVPLARYVLEHRAQLVFPFRRYQMQKVWRGERPQDGRFREFLQADIDIIGEGTLPFHHEVEVLSVAAAALAALPIPEVEIQVNNRKILTGMSQGLGIDDSETVLRNLDKLDKIGADAVRSALLAEGLEEAAVECLLELVSISTTDTGFVDRVHKLGVTNPLLEEGLHELSQVITALAKTHPGMAVAKLSIARGLDYYTGTVFEVVMRGYESLGSICAGGRYETLATDGKRTYPGVGLALGVTRMLSKLLETPLLQASRIVPSCVAIAVTDEASRGESEEVARILRRRGIPCEVISKAAKFGKQIRYAERRGIPYVWFPDSGEVKDIRSGEQVAASATTWQPPEEDLRVRVLPTD